MDFDFLAEADGVTLKLELAKRAVETAKGQFDEAKRAYDELFSRAEEHGIPKAKLKKLTEERVQALIESGILEKAAGADSKKERPPRKKTKTQAEKTEDVDFIEGEEEARMEAEASI